MAKNYTSHSYWNRILNGGICKFLILRALHEGPAHGYEVIRRVAGMTDQFCTPAQGTIYPVLEDFRKSGCVTCRQEVVNGRIRKVYTLTPKGLQAYQAGLEVWQKGLCCVKCAVEQR